MMRQRIYMNGVLTRSTKPNSAETVRRWLDNADREWSAHLGPLVGPGEFDPNNGHEVTRVSEDELRITTTGGHHLRIVNVEVK